MKLLSGGWCAVRERETDKVPAVFRIVKCSTSYKQRPFKLSTKPQDNKPSANRQCMHGQRKTKRNPRQKHTYDVWKLMRYRHNQRACRPPTCYHCSRDVLEGFVDAEACLFAYPAPGSSMPRAHVAQMRRAEEHREIIGPAVDDPIPGERSQAGTQETAEFILFSGWKVVARCLSTYLFFRWKIN